jgi:hypothetical protein
MDPLPLDSTEGQADTAGRCHESRLNPTAKYGRNKCHCKAALRLEIVGKKMLFSTDGCIWILIAGSILDPTNLQRRKTCSHACMLPNATPFFQCCSLWLLLGYVPLSVWTMSHGHCQDVTKFCRQNLGLLATSATGMCLPSSEVRIV